MGVITNVSKVRDMRLSSLKVRLGRPRVAGSLTSVFYLVQIKEDTVSFQSM